MRNIILILFLLSAVVIMIQAIPVQGHRVKRDLKALERIMKEMVEIGVGVGTGSAYRPG
uniref:Venom peptide n=1 Tax=Heterorhabditis bacteriophora TaxID=37862 RepID=A0A1I7X5G2_HETBA